MRFANLNIAVCSLQGLLIRLLLLIDTPCRATLPKQNRLAQSTKKDGLTKKYNLWFESDCFDTGAVDCLPVSLLRNTLIHKMTAGEMRQMLAAQ